MSRIFEYVFTGIFTVVVAVLLGAVGLVVLGGVLLVPVAFPLTTLAIVCVVVIWLAGAWVRQKRAQWAHKD